VNPPPPPSPISEWKLNENEIERIEEYRHLLVFQNSWFSKSTIVASAQTFYCKLVKQCQVENSFNLTGQKQITKNHSRRELIKFRIQGVFRGPNFESKPTGILISF